jgi:hypothetical protein
VKVLKTDNSHIIVLRREINDSTQQARMVEEINGKEEAFWSPSHPAFSNCAKNIQESIVAPYGYLA